MATITTVRFDSKIKDGSISGSSADADKFFANFEAVPAKKKETRAIRAAAAGTKIYEKEVLTIKDWPEIKRTTVKKCKKVLGKKVCVNWPQLWKRTSRLSVFLVITYPTGFDKDVKECAVLSLTAAILAMIASGNPAAAQTAFTTAFKACLVKKGSEVADRVRVKFDTRKVEGAWRQI